MYNTSFGGFQTFGQNIEQGVLDSYGLGTVIRDLATPQGNTYAPNYYATIPMLGPIYQGAKSLVESFRPDQPSLTLDQYKASPYYREAIPWEPGMTMDRAAALASFLDIKTARAQLSEKQPVAAFLGQFVGQFFDPINYIPVFGAGVHAATVARAAARFGTLGSIGARAGLASSEAAISTAAFGLMTADLRRRFGDDTSWAAMSMEIGMSALIGGVFGGGIGVFTRGADMRSARGYQLGHAMNSALDRLDTAATQQESLVALNDAVSGMVSGGEVRLTPNGTAGVERVVSALRREVDSVRELVATAETVREPRAGQAVVTPAGSRVEVRPEVVDASQLVRASGALQVRNRGTAASAAQIEDIAINLDPARLMPSMNAELGAPLVGPDNIVDSGNGRFQAIQRAYEAYPERAAAYRKAIEAAGYDTTGMQRPVLISRRVTDLSPEARAKFNAEANTASTARMSAVELAGMDRAAAMRVANLYAGGDVTSAANRPFVDRFLSELPQNERGALVDEGGTRLSADGVRRLENALVAAAFGDIDPTVIRRFAEATDDNTRAIIGAMSDVAGRWAQMRQAVKLGEVQPEFDTTPELTEALRHISRWREQAVREKRAVSTVIREGMAQGDILSGDMPIETRFFIRSFYNNDHFAVATGRDKLAEGFERMVDKAFALSQPTMFEDLTPVTKLRMMQDAIALETNLFAAPDDVGSIRGGEELSAAPQTGAGDGQAADAGAAAGSVAPALRAPGFRGGSAEIVRTMTQRLIDAGRPADEAQANGEMVAAFMSTLSRRLGWSVDQTVQQYGLPEVLSGSELPPGSITQSGRNPPQWREGDMLGNLETERGQEGFGQSLVPGVKPITEADRMAQRAGKPLKGGEAPPAKGSLFDIEGRKDAAAQMTLFQPAYHGTPHIFDKFDSSINVTGFEQRNRGSILFDGNRSLITLLESADASTALHEISHDFLRMFKSAAELADAAPEIAADWTMVKGWWSDNAAAVAKDSPADGVTVADVRAVLETGASGDRVKDLAINVGLQEQWARAFEAYTREGVAPTEGLRGVFEQFKRWLTAIYRRAIDLNVNLSADIRQVFDNMLGGERPRGTIPEFSRREADPIPQPTGLTEAAARVGRPDTMREITDDHRVDLASGDYPEAFDIDQLRAAGRLSEEDVAALDAADADYKSAEAFGNAMKAGLACMLKGNA